MSVKVCKLITGEDIIADVEVDQNGYTFNNPALIVVQQTQDGRVGAAFAPFAPYAKDNKVRIYKNYVIGEMEIDVKLINEYNRIFGSGIMIASANEMPSSQIIS
jgi:hypothetical protein